MASRIKRGFLPDSDTALLAWSLNFATKLQNSSIEYGISGPLAQQYQLLHVAFATALAECDPGDRSKALVAAKNLARTNLKNDARLLAKLVEGTASVTDQQKIELDLNVRKPPVPSPVPATTPFVEVVNVNGRTVTLKIRASHATSGKPKGVSGVSVFSHYGAEPPAAASGWKFELMSGRTTVQVTFDDVETAGTVYVTAFWFNGRMETGLASAPIAINLPAATPLPQMKMAKKAA